MVTGCFINWAVEGTSAGALCFIVSQHTCTIELGNMTSQNSYFGLDVPKPRQLYRAYQELVWYQPEIDPEAENRYSLIKLEAFQRVYRELWEKGEVAREGTQWHRDNQFCYTMHLTSLHNTDIRLDRSANKGVFTARYEAADELVDKDVDVRRPTDIDVDEADVPSVLNFLPPDIFRDFLKQEAPALSDTAVAFPMQHEFQEGRNG